ncbi:unknown [Brachyspira sp. CAG:484]|nr:unknown [Brachyspira sp. CAG:484]
MTLPSLVNRTRQKELETAFQKQYTLLQQAIMKIKYEDELPFERSSYSSDFKKRLAEEYKATKDCGAINYNTGCVLLEENDVFSYYKTLTGKNLDRKYFDDGGFITIDGTTFFIEQGAQSADTGYLVSIDVNGYKKKPNLMGYDFFMFQITREGKVLPMGADNTYWKDMREAYCSKTSSANLNGFTCAYFALTDKDYFKNLH